MLKNIGAEAGGEIGEVFFTQNTIYFWDVKSIH
jgi:hypothetical protein